MTFQEELKAQLAEMIPEDKRGEFEEKAAGVFDRMGQYFQKTETSIADMKKALAEAKKAGSGKSADGEGIDPREYESLKKTLEERESAFEELTSKYSEVSRKHTSTEKLAKELADKYSAESNSLSELVKQSELRKAIGLLSLTEGTGDEVFSLLASNVKVKVGDKGERKVAAYVTDAEGKLIEKPLAEYVKDWASNSPLAKRVLAAPRNSGGGAQGAQGSIGGPATLEQKYMDAQKAGNVAMMLMLKSQMAAGAE